MNLHREDLHFERSSHGLRVSHLNRENGIARKSQKRDTRETRDELFQELEPLPGHLADDRGVPRDVAARSSETVYEPGPHGVLDTGHQNGNALGGFFRGQNRRRAGREHDVKLERDKLGGQRGKTLKSAFRPSCLVRDVPPLLVAEFPHTQPKRIEQRRICIVEVRGEKTNTEYLSLLRIDSERRGEEASRKCADETSPVHYSITWSARPSTDGGIVSPNALAVLRLITNSNLVGCSTGRSAGLAPLRILST